MSNNKTRLTPVKLDENTTIYIETQDNIEEVNIDEENKQVPDNQETQAEDKPQILTPEEAGMQEKGIVDNIVNVVRRNDQATSPTEAMSQNFQAIENTIKAYTDYTLNAFKQVAAANIDKVSLEFGISIGGKAGIPYVTEGTANSSLKITVECSFPSD